MVAERELGAAVDERLHQLDGIHMLIAHEPARLVGTDRQNGEPERSVALARIAEMAAVTVAGVGYEIDAAAWRLDHERGPIATCFGQISFAPTSVAWRPGSRRIRRRYLPDPPSRRLRPRLRGHDFVMMVSLPSGVITRGRCAAASRRAS